MRVAACQLPAFPESDDKIFTTENAVIMLDGASAFAPVPVSPGTYTTELGTAITERLTDAPGGDLEGILAAAIETTARNLDLVTGRGPSSTVTIVRLGAGWLDVLVLGDNLVAVRGKIITDERLEQLDLDPGRRYRQRLAEGTGFDDTHRQILRELQTQQASRRNRADGYWIAEADPNAARHAIVHRFPLGDAPWVVLATDGAYTPMRHLGLTNWTHLATLDSDGLRRTVQHCQNWEADLDPTAQKLPRAKRHDDKSLAVIRTD